MSSNVPTARQVAWISIIPQLSLMGFLIFVSYLLDFKDFFLVGVLSYLVISILLRNIIPRAHKSGMALVRKEQFLEAIPHFERSYEFFKRNEWIDKFRYITLLSSSKMSYKEMALNNIAFCFGQAGDGVKAREFYERTLREFPESGMAKAGLRLLNSVSV
jgi:hypothetical protein